jgi:hypothetical protein
MTQACDQTCFHCAQTWFLWLKNREGQMSKPQAKKGEKTSFASAAATSNRAPRPLEACHCTLPVGSSVTFRGLPETVTFNPGFVGLDGRHFVKLSSGMHVPCGSVSR